MIVTNAGLLKNIKEIEKLKTLSMQMQYQNY